MSGKKQDTKKKPQQDQSQGDFQNDEDPSDQEIQDDGEVSSVHQSSIDLEEYKKQRDNIPDDPSDLQDDEEEDFDSDEYEQQEEEEDQYQEEDQESSDKPKKKAVSKKAALETKKKEKDAGAKAKPKK